LRPLQVCAQRLGTGECFECLIEPEGGWPLKVTHLGWKPEDRARAVREEDFDALWRDFRREDDILVAWKRRSADALGAEREPLILKGAWAELGRPTGDMGVLLARCGLSGEPTAFRGRAGAQMGQALALIDYLREQPDSTDSVSARREQPDRPRGGSRGAARRARRGRG
jgi:hypothetical protein